jgi:hypothetical protein
MSYENKKCFTWNYETTYYHIYAPSDLLDGGLDPIFIESPRSAQNDVDVQDIVDALNRIASRMEPGKGLPPSPRAWFISSKSVQKKTARKVRLVHHARMNSRYKTRGLDSSAHSAGSI